MNSQLMQDPVGMETPEEFKLWDWGFDDPDSEDYCDESPIQFRRNDRFTANYAFDRDAAIAANRAYGDTSEPVPISFEKALAAAFHVCRDLVVFDKSLVEIDRWEYKP